MVLRSLVISFFSVSLLVLQVQEVQGQDPGTTSIGGIIGTNIGKAMGAARLARGNMIAFNNAIMTARHRYWECGGTCADKDQIEAEFGRLLWTKDFYYLLRTLIRSEMRRMGVAGAHHDELVSRVLGPADGGITASGTHRRWAVCLEREMEQGHFVGLSTAGFQLRIGPSPEAFQACRDRYIEHKQRRDLLEYYEQPGKKEALLDPDSLAVGASLFKEERQATRTGILGLPSGIEGQEILVCEYGPFTTETDDKLLHPEGSGWVSYRFWYGKIPLTRAELREHMLRSSASWPNWRRRVDPRRRYLRISEIALTTCPPGDLNAGAITKKYIDLH